MFGGLHIEMALWKFCAELLGPDWTDMLSNLLVYTSVTTESFLKVSHLTKTSLMVGTFVYVNAQITKLSSF